MMCSGVKAGGVCEWPLAFVDFNHYGAMPIIGMVAVSERGLGSEKDSGTDYDGT